MTLFSFFYKTINNLDKYELMAQKNFKNYKKE